MKMLRLALFGLVLIGSTLVPSVSATSFSTDQSDLYYIQAESGWGVQLVQRGSVIFATMFVYGPAGAPTWYVAAMQSVGNSMWTGDLFAATGPWFGTVPFDPNAVMGRRAGTMTWTAQTLSTGTLAYVVDGVAVTKNVVRETTATDDYSGTYLGALHLMATNCTNPTDNASGEIPFTTISVTQNGQSATLTMTILVLTLTITGTVSQDGQFGTVAGTYTSSVGEAGNATVSAMNVQVNSLTASFNLNSTNNGCQNSGYFAAMRSRP
ncbi:MAG TPA: hypothetical protein VGK37_15640 [Casimicrobiaceae bacterium]